LVLFGKKYLLCSKLIIMNMKTTLILIVCILCYSMSAQVITNEQDSTAQIIPIFKKGQKLTYKVNRINHTPEEKDTTNYHLNFKFGETKGDFVNATIYLDKFDKTDLESVLLNGVKSEIYLNIAKAEFSITNEEEVNTKIKKNIKKGTRKFSNDSNLSELISSLEQQLNEGTFSVTRIYQKDINAIFGFYKKEISYQYYNKDTIPKNDPMGHPSKQVRKYGVFKVGENYEFIHSSEILNDGIKEAMRKDTEKAIREQFKDSLDVEGKPIEISEIIIEDQDVDVEVTKDVRIMYASESGIVSSFSLEDKKNIFDLKLLLKRTLTLLE